MMGTVSLLSGGLDSVVATAVMAEKGEYPIHGLYVAYGQRSDGPEWQACQDLKSELGLASLVRVSTDLYSVACPEHLMFSQGESLERDPALDIAPYEIPFRNGILMSMAAAYAQLVGASKIISGSKAGPIGTVCRDDTTPFLYAFDNALQLEHGGISLVLPLDGWSKDLIFEKGEALGLSLSKCWGCFGEGPLPCRVCKRCRSYIKLGLYA